MRRQPVRHFRCADAGALRSAIALSERFLKRGQLSQTRRRRSILFGPIMRFGLRPYSDFFHRVAGLDFTGLVSKLVKVPMTDAHFDLSCSWLVLRQKTEIMLQPIGCTCIVTHDIPLNTQALRLSANNGI